MTSEEINTLLSAGGYTYRYAEGFQEGWITQAAPHWPYKIVVSCMGADTLATKQRAYEKLMNGELEWTR